VLHPVVLVALLVSITLILIVPRKYVIMPLLVPTLLLPARDAIVIAGAHIFVFRIILLFGWIRLAAIKFGSQTSLLAGRFNSIDAAFSLWAVFHGLAFILLYLQPAAVINQLGFLWDAFACYFLLRLLIQDEADIHRAIQCFAVLVVIVAICMVNEQLTGQNVIGLIGGVRSVSEIRAGRIRSQAVFQHPILAGTFGATLLPLFFWLWKSGKSKFAALLAAISSIVMTVTSACSTPVVSCAAAILATSIWPFRKQMRALRWGIVIALIALFLFMKAPVWFLIDRIELVGGSSGYHRAMLVDQFIRNFGDWWLLGTNANQNWGDHMWDTSNAYVEEGQTGGLLSLVLFIAMISRCFGKIGTARKSVEGADPGKEWFLWFLGAALFAHTIAFFGISYFDQTRVAWFATLAIVSAATASILDAKSLSPQPQVAMPSVQSRWASSATRMSASAASSVPFEYRTKSNPQFRQE
jgi:hypothetical protein